MFFSEEKNQKTFNSAPLAGYQAMAGKPAQGAEVFIGACAHAGGVTLLTFRKPQLALTQENESQEKFSAAIEADGVAAQPLP